MLSRVRVNELMDRPDLPAQEHELALRGLESINRISRTAQALLPPIQSLGRRELTLLDIACGGGDVPVTLARLARAQGIDLHLTLFDRSETALSRALTSARQAGIPCQTLCGDLVRDDLPQADVVTNSLFLHHLDRGDAVLALSRLYRAAGRLVIVSDLRRSRMGLALAWTTTRLLSPSHIVRHDGPISVRAAWSIPELRQMADDAGMESASIRHCWPWRMLLVYRKDRT